MLPKPPSPLCFIVMWDTLTKAVVSMSKGSHCTVIDRSHQNIERKGAKDRVMTKYTTHWVSFHRWPLSSRSILEWKFSLTKHGTANTASVTENGDWHARSLVNQVGDAHCSGINFTHLTKHLHEIRNSNFPALFFCPAVLPASMPRISKRSKWLFLYQEVDF